MPVFQFKLVLSSFGHFFVTINMLFRFLDCYVAFVLKLVLAPPISDVPRQIFLGKRSLAASRFVSSVSVRGKAIHHTLKLL